MDLNISSYEGIKEELDKLFEKALAKKFFSGATAGISIGNPRKRKKLIVAYGRTSYESSAEEVNDKVCFDLASLTKPLATTLAVLALIKEKKIGLSQTLPQLLEEKIADEKSLITLRHILSHSAGFPAHRPYFEKLMETPPENRKALLHSLIISEPLVGKPGEQSLYSDLGFMLLGRIIEIKSGERLDRFVENKIYKPLGAEKGMFYNPLAEKNRQDKVFAATEHCPWRHKTLYGEVSDDNAYAVGGVAGQAGLFGDIESVLAMTIHLLDQWKKRETPENYDSDDLSTFLTRQEQIKESTWALGFDTPSKTGSSSGKYLSEKSVGHLGFTGTSFWIDPTRDLVMVLLTNRVHPSRDNDAIKRFRPQFHDTVIEQLGLQ